MRRMRLFESWVEVSPGWTMLVRLNSMTAYRCWELVRIVDNR
jgi:hypothetical protein